MKKLILILTIVFTSLVLHAQNINPESDNVGRVSGKGKKSYSADSLLSRWCIDLNLTGGILMQDYTSNLAANYAHAVNSNIGGLKFNNGATYGVDAELAYFFGYKKHLGIGTGVMYMYQQGTATIDNFHIEYQSTDFQGNTFRQLVTSNGAVKESLNITNLNIPILLKYKKRLSRRIGITADAGALINLQVKNYYNNNNTSFDYEAIYKYANNENGSATVYDNSPVPGTSDLLITKAQYLSTHSTTDISNYFNTLRGEGYNVGLGMKPTNNTGNTSFTTGTIGLLLRPAVSFYLSDKVALNLGAFYLYQNFNHTVSNNYVTTDKAGSYNPLLNGVSTSVNNAYGVSFGVRYFFVKLRDSDGDGVPDKRDRCPLEAGPKKYQGCPDTDGDGIPDIDDNCPDVPGLAIFNGCPDSDGDGIPDNEDACPYEAGLAKYDGCPDTDGDGIPDREDACPLVYGLAIYHGCPDTDGDGVPDNLDQCPTVPGPESNHGCPLATLQPNTGANTETNVSISTPIYFKFNSTTIKEESYPVLEEAARELANNKKTSVVINGYASIEGSKAHNYTLSEKRALAVKKYLAKKGVNTKLLQIVAHGSNDPAARNKTEEGREMNRRAVIKLNHHKTKMTNHKAKK